jgi:hypothetical protein
MCGPGQSPGGYAGMADALAVAEASLAFIARADAASLPVEGLADGLRALERAESVHTAARRDCCRRSRRRPVPRLMVTGRVRRG